MTSRQAPFLSNKHIIDAMKAVEENDFYKAGKVLHLDMIDTEECNMSHIDLVQTVIAHWLKETGFKVPSVYQEYAKKKCKTIEKWVKEKHSDPINCSFVIVGVGENETGSVVPEDWIGREFEDAVSCHSEMDNLANRQGKPPVKFCLTRNLIKQDKQVWKNIKEATNRPQFIVGYVGGKSVLENIKSEKQWQSWKSENNCNHWYSTMKNHLVLVVTDLVSNDSLKQEMKKNSIGLLVSTLQKAIRRGSGNVDLVSKIIDDLSISQPYHLPEHQYMKVSAYRQMCWRLFVIALEDCSLFTSSHCASLKDLFCLSVICNTDPDFILPSKMVNLVKETSKLLCTSTYLCNWRLGSEQEPKWTDNEISHVLYSAYHIMPMMSGDKTMIAKYSNLLETGINIPVLKKSTTNTSITSVMKNTIVAGVDMHCFPNIILQLQACIPCDTMTTREVSNYIWENSSKFNTRENCVKCDARFVQHLLFLQEHYLNPKSVILPTFSLKKSPTVKSRIVSDVGRISFLLLFGFPVTIPKSKKYPLMEVLVAGPSINDAYLVREKTKEDMRPVEDEEQIKYAVKKFYETAVGFK